MRGPHVGDPDVTVVLPTYNRADWLRGAIASVLRQTHENFVLIVSDNASDDNTPEVVRSFDDRRLEYVRHETNVGRHANIDRLIDRVETEYVVILCDDDALEPGHLAATSAGLKRWPAAGVAHTGCVSVDVNGAIRRPHVRFVETASAVVVESGEQFRKRSMREGWTVCFSSAMFRRPALLEADRLREEDGIVDDFPLMLRISTRWDFVYVNEPLVRFRVHGGAASSPMGQITTSGYRSAPTFPELMYEHRLRYLDEAGLSDGETRRLRGLAETTYRRERVRHLSMRANTGDGLLPPLRSLGLELRHDPRLALEPLTWRFVAGQLGGRSIRSAVRRRARAS
jgi:glycosyltransferase involved in cell wall biosynthesis